MESFARVLQNLLFLKKFRKYGMRWKKIISKQLELWDRLLSNTAHKYFATLFYQPNQVVSVSKNNLTITVVYFHLQYNNKSLWKIKIFWSFVLHRHFIFASIFITQFVFLVRLFTISTNLQTSMNELYSGAGATLMISLLMSHCWKFTNRSMLI